MNRIRTNRYFRILASVVAINITYDFMMSKWSASIPKKYAKMHLVIHEFYAE